MIIKKRLAEEQFCFTEIHFDSLDEYEKGYPEFQKVYLKLKKKKVEEIEFESPVKLYQKQQIAKKEQIAETFKNNLKK